MIRPTVEVILTYVDKLTAPLRGTSTGVRGLFSDMTKSVSSFVGGFVAIGSITMFLRQTWEAADRLTQSFDRVGGTAKIVNVPLEEVQKTAAKAREEFGLSAAAANNFASSAVTMAAKAGDVSKSGDLMAAVLDLAAARGIKAEEALEALNITLKGQDEGLDKLVQKNPSAYYKSWADAAGRSAGSLTELEKKLAIVDGLITEGARVRGSYTQWLETTAGKAFLATQAMEDANAKFGVATESLRNLTLSAKVWVAETLGGIVGFVQKLGVNLALMWDGIQADTLSTLGTMMQAIGEFLTNSRVAQLILGETLIGVADQMADAGVRMQVQAERDRRVINQVRAEMYAEIEGAHAAAELGMTTITETETEQRTDKTGKELEKQRAEAEKAFGAIAQAFSDAYRTEENSAIKKAQDAIAEIDEALRTQIQLTDEQRQQLERMADTYALNVFLVKQGVDLEEELKVVRDLVGEELRMQELNRLRDEAIALREREGANAATVAYYDEFIADTEKEIVRAMREHVGFQRAIDDATRATALAHAMLRGDLEQVVRLASELAGETEDVEEGWYSIDRELINAARGAVSLAQEMGAVDDRSAKVLSNVINLADVLQKGLGSLAAGDIIGAVGALAGVIGGLFGESPAARAQKQLLQRNTDALQRLAQVNGLLLTAQTPGAKIEKFQSLEGNDTLIEGLRASFAHPEMRRTLFSRHLMASGLTISDAEQLAKDLGIDLGTFKAEAVQQFLDAIATADFSAFEQSFGGFLDRIDFEGRLAGGLTAPEELARIRDALSQDFGSSLLAQQFAGVDLSTAAGRQALLSRVLGIGQNVEGLSPGQRGGLTGQEFTDIIVRITDLLRSSLESTTGGSVPDTPAAPAAAGGVEVSTAAPEVPVPATPVVFTGSGFGLSDLATLLGDKMDLMLDQGRRMIDLQGRIANATEETALVAGVIARQGGTTGGSSEALDLLLQAELDRANQTLGGGV